METTNVVLICDYGIGDPAFIEVELQIRRFAKDIRVLSLSTPPFSTLNTGFWIAQIALSGHTPSTFIFSNTAPRKEDDRAQKNNNGEKLMYARLKNGLEIMAIHAGYNFSFIKHEIEAFHYVHITNEGSQFRSRDIYPQAVAKMLTKDKAFLGTPCETAIVPDYQRSAISSIDGYGNIKTTMKLSEIPFKPGQRMQITINKHSRLATFTDGTFNIPQGELALAPGSSGHHDRFMEIFYRGKSARELFGMPSVEDPIEAKKALK